MLLLSIEWNGVKKSPSNLSNNNSAEEHNEDDEEINPLQLLARHSVEYPCRIQERYCKMIFFEKNVLNSNLLKTKMKMKNLNS